MLRINLWFTRKKVKLQGLFSAEIPYEVRVPDGDNSKFFGSNFEGQKYGPYDTNTCWAFGAINVIETQLEIERSLGRFSEAQLKWFKDNGYIDKDGDFFLSRRWLAILAGSKDNGNDEALAWKLAAEYGLIPFSMLPYTKQDAEDENTKQEFIDEYFDPSVITAEMKAMGKEFKKYVKIQSEELGTRWTTRSDDVFEKALKQGSVQIGVPVPGWAWNQVQVKWDGDKVPAHSVEKYRHVRTEAFPHKIYDTYFPNKKELEAGYYVPLVTRGIVTAIKEEMLSPKLSTSVWKEFVNILRRLGILV